jgi:hypothetical protein
MSNKNIEEAINKIFTVDIQNIIFIYTPPKVGSTTLVSSLRISLGKSFNVIHIHDDIMLNVLTGIQNVTVNEIIEFMASQGKNIFVIDVYRTPIERKMSEFFEKISPYHFNNTEDKINKYNIKRISDRFNKLFPHIGCGDHYIEKYNICETIEFDFEKKYIIKKVNNIKYIKIRLCDSSIWDKILSTILKTDIVLINDYQTEIKEIGDLYSRFKKEYVLPLNLFDLVTECKYLKIYYSQEEREKYLETWKNKTTITFTPYSHAEYVFYLNLCLENQHINDIQVEHYIDNGCFCELCNKKRKEYYVMAKNGEKKFNKIIHNDVVNKNIETKTKTVINKIKLIKDEINKEINKKKFKPKQFAIQIK